MWGLNSVISVSILNEETSDLFLSLFPEVLSVLRFSFSHASLREKGEHHSGLTWREPTALHLCVD